MKYLIVILFFLSSFSLDAQFFNSPNWDVEDEKTVLSIYPNPTTDYFKVKGANIARISLYNIFGREVKTYEYESQASYDVTNIRNGVYIVRLIDQKGNMLKTLKLSIR